MASEEIAWQKKLLAFPVWGNTNFFVYCAPAVERDSAGNLFSS
jgi:hypothetical protein